MQSPNALLSGAPKIIKKRRATAKCQHRTCRLSFSITRIFRIHGFTQVSFLGYFIRKTNRKPMEITENQWKLTKTWILKIRVMLKESLHVGCWHFAIARRFLIILGAPESRALGLSNTSEIIQFC